MVVASCTGHHSLGGRGLAPVLRWDMRPEKPACPVSPVLRNTSTCSLIHTAPWRSSLIPLNNSADQDDKNTPSFFHFWGDRAVLFLLALCVEPAQELLGQALELAGGEQQPPPSRWQSAPRSHWDVLETSAQGTRIHSPYQGLGSI